MIYFNNDYNRGAHESILEALASCNGESYSGYGLDDWCRKAEKEIKKHIKKEEADVHFMLGGTQTNYTVISAALRPYESVISADSGHINVHETGAVEHCGHKIETVPAVNGKITVEQIRNVAENFASSEIKEHITEPKMVYLSFPTEYGTLYSKNELEDIHKVCKAYDLYLYVDGARMGYGLGAEENDVTLEDFANLCDAFYIGGTKCGAMFGEAVVIVDNYLKRGFRSFMKQNGGMLAKGWLLGVQFYSLFCDETYFNITKAAVEKANKLKAAFAAKGIPFFVESCTNQQFVVVTEEQMNKLSEKYVFEYFEKVDETKSCIRFCTSWSTRWEEIEQLIGDIACL